MVSQAQTACLISMKVSGLARATRKQCAWLILGASQRSRAGKAHLRASNLRTEAAPAAR